MNYGNQLETENEINALAAIKIKELTAENATLCAALARLVDASDPDNLEEEHGLDQLSFAREAARQALGSREGE
jgi:hypothetical protein